MTSSKKSSADIADKLFQSPYKEMITKGLPLLFKQEQTKSSRGGKAGMEVGNARERVIIALFMYVFGRGNVQVPSTTSIEEDIVVHGIPISIKTKAGNSNTGIKLKWTNDWEKVKEFIRSYSPSCDMLFVKIVWGGQSDLYYIPCNVQNEIFQKLGKKRYMKEPTKGTNQRGVELSSEAVELMIDSPDTRRLVLEWGEPDKDLKNEIYDEYIEKWKQIANNNL